MKAFTTITPAYQEFCERCLVDSWKKSNPEVPLEIILDESSEAEGNADFRSPGFDYHVANKMFILSELAASERDPFLVTDADIIYFRDIRPVVVDGLNDAVDILIARDCLLSEDYNIGQMIIRPSARTQEFFSRVASLLMAGFSHGRGGAANQDLVVTLLKQSKEVDWAGLPKSFANTPIFSALSEIERREIYSMHLTHTWVRDGVGSLAQKWAMFKSVSEAYLRAE